KQLWNLGIHDRKVTACISKMLKAEIDKEGIPFKGVPQGGILSTLLSNIVLTTLTNGSQGNGSSSHFRKTINQKSENVMPRKVRILKKDILYAMRMILKFFVEMGKRLKNGIMRSDYTLKNVYS